MLSNISNKFNCKRRVNYNSFIIKKIMPEDNKQSWCGHSADRQISHAQSINFMDEKALSLHY